MKGRKGRVAGHVARRVEAEFDLPFWEVIAGFARDGESVRGTALIVGYRSAEGLRSLIERHNMGNLFHAKGHDSNGWRSAKIGKAKTPAQSAASRANIAAVNARRSKLREFEFGGFTGTLKAHAEARGLVYNTVRARLGRGMSMERALYRGLYVARG